MDYNYLYRKLNKRTPIKADCGKLCRNACCMDEGDEELGMYLFPGEEEMFAGIEGFKIEESDFKYEKRNAKIVFCTPFCKRNKRPLSCRIFPLFPYITKNNKLKVIIDPRSKFICPLSKLNKRDFSPAFVRGVKHIGKALIREKETFDFLFSLSRLIDDYSDFI